ncbi:TonB-dependent receptor plug domain-containing protein [Marinicaulis aureus]|uniref:TonB-dependent receptor plug domain-containing protein n=1 Tax=Hyphococcus aureus TaxID=2666033 RepID=A0ABW1KTS8_9PROT
MKKTHKLNKTQIFASVCMAALFCVQPSSAQGGDTDDEVVVTGVRGLPRSVQDSAVPIDVFSEGDLEGVSYTDVNDVLLTLVPSYTLSRQPISDGSSFIRPASLRGLPTDKTLVLVNSKRRHRAALVSIGGSGTQGPDVATIPAIALKSVEVLRDGAAAQYGSDAIAGVINFILKDSADSITFTAQTGQFYEGDGFEYIFAGNAGFGLGEDGFVNISLEYSHSDSTVRAEQYCESWFCVPTVAAMDPTFAAGVEAASLADGDIVQPWGRPNSEAFRSFVNMGYTFSDAVEFYAFGNFSDSTADGNFFYRYPGNGTIEDIRLEDGSVYNFLEIFPGGFTPQFHGDVTDYSGAGGFRGDLGGGFSYDVSGRVGVNKIEYFLENTVNPSLGPDTPTEFYPGDLINKEAQFQADLAQVVDLDALAGPLTIGFGASYMKESYELIEGDPASYASGPFALPDPFDFCDGMTGPTAAGMSVAGLDCTDPDDPVFTVIGVGSNGFPGYSPEFSGKYTRNSKAFYLDVSADITESWFLQGAVRYENYSDFDSQLIYKFATRYELVDGLAVRGSYGTGFRAPTPGQQGTTNVSTRLPNGFPVATGLFPASSPVAQALGASPLEPETSKNIAAGVTASFAGINLSVDFYRIALEDRVNAISTQDVSSDPMAGAAYDNYLALVGAGVAGAESIGGVFYFANAFDTVTKGVDFVATTDFDLGGAGTTSLSLAANYNETEFDGDVDALFNAEDQFDFVNSEPNWRGIFTAIHNIGGLTALGRVSYYGPYENDNGPIQEFDGEFLLDLELSYTFMDHYKLSVGARNILDNYPDPGMIGETCCGRIYRSDSIVDWQGGYYYGRVEVSF